MKKDRKKLIIVGGGVSGLVTAYAMRKYKDLDVTVLEHRNIGGHFLYGGYKYARRTDEFASMLHDLECVYSTYSPNGGIMLKGECLRYPTDFKELDNDYTNSIRKAFYQKTRRVDAGKSVTKAFSDPFSYLPARALRADFEDVIAKLAHRTNIMNAAFIKKDGEFCVTTAGKIKFDYMIFTIPLSAIQGRVDFYVPEAVSTKLSVIEILPRIDPYYRFDYLYTPFTPEGHVHRISSNGHTYFAEISGDIDQMKAYSDLNFLFKGAWSPISGKRNLRGFLMPMTAKARWPKNIRPVGRYSQWLPKMTIDMALDEAIRVGQEWFE